MKATMTKREFNNKMAELVKKMRDLLEKENDMQKAQDAGKTVSHEEWQKIIDEQELTDAAIDSLDRKYNRRYWTASDYASAELIAQNID